MLTSPHIITVDTTGSIARIVRATADLLDRSITLIDMTTGEEALEFLRGHESALLVSAVELDDNMKGYQLAIEASKVSPETHVIILAENSDPELDADELAGDSPYVYMHRPVDLSRFARVMVAAMNGDDLFEALAQPASSASPAAISGALPQFDVEIARPIIDALLTDVGAMAIVFSNRAGDVLLERGAVGYLDREKLTHALLPMIGTTVEMGELVGGQTKTLHFYDGTDYDVFVLSVGLHHFLCLVFNGEAGNRAFGAVNRFGRRAAEDLTALLGASAFVVEKAEPAEEAPRRSKRRAQQPEPEETYEPIERAEIAVEEEEPLQLEPIADLDMSIFDTLDNLDDSAAEDLFDPEKLADIANKNDRKGGPIDFDQARELGIMPKLDN